MTPGPAGSPGVDGVTPHIGENGNWFIGDNDTGIAATGPKGVDGQDGESALVINATFTSTPIVNVSYLINRTWLNREPIQEETVSGTITDDKDIVYWAVGEIIQADSSPYTASFTDIVKLTGPQGTKGKDGAKGEDGFTPEITIQSIANGHIVSISKKEGEPETFLVSNGESGNNGVTFTPSVSHEGILSWTNDGGLQNPEPVDIKGPSGSGENLIYGNGLTKDDNTVSVTTPVNGIVTQEEFDALSEAQQNNGMYVVKEDGDGSGGSSGGHGDVYSTEEVRIGTWIDGKPLYRKVFTNCPYPANSTVNENFVPGTKAEDLDIETLVKIEFFDVNTFENKNFPDFIVSGSGLCILYSSWYRHLGATISVTKLNISSSISFSFTNLHLVLEYTKTTDEPEVIS